MDLEQTQAECRLRRLNLCDGDRTVYPPPRCQPTPCWCVQVDMALREGMEITATNARHYRALVLSKSHTVQALLYGRELPF